MCHRPMRLPQRQLMPLVSNREAGPRQRRRLHQIRRLRHPIRVTESCLAPSRARLPKAPAHPFIRQNLFFQAVCLLAPAAGSQIALHPLWRNYWGGVHVNGHLEVDVAPGWRAAVQAGYHGFFPRSASVKYAAVTHYSVLAKYHRPLIGSMQLNAFGGAGLYRSPSATNPGMQLGAGVESAHSSNVRFFAHVTTHQTTVASQLGAMRWVDFSVGFSVRAR